MAKKKSTNKETEESHLPPSLKKFRQSPEIEGFYRFIYENDLRVETFGIIDRISQKRKAGKRKSKTT